MGKSSSRPSEPKPSEHEKELGRQGVQKWNRYIDRYALLEEQDLATLAPDRQGRIAAHTNAQLMSEATDNAMAALGSPDTTTSIRNLGQINSALSRAGAAGYTQSIASDRARRDQEKFGAIQRGMGVAGSQTQALSALGRQETEQALSRYTTQVRSRMQRESDRVQAISGLAQAAGSVYTGNVAQAQQSQRLGSAMHQAHYGNRNDFMGRMDGSLQLDRW